MKSFITLLLAAVIGKALGNSTNSTIHAINSHTISTKSFWSPEHTTSCSACKSCNSTTVTISSATSNLKEIAKETTVSANGIIYITTPMFVPMTRSIYRPEMVIATKTITDLSHQTSTQVKKFTSFPISTNTKFEIHTIHTTVTESGTKTVPTQVIKNISASVTLDQRFTSLAASILTHANFFTSTTTALLYSTKVISDKRNDIYSVMKVKITTLTTTAINTKTTRALKTVFLENQRLKELQCQKTASIN